ncbi:MAG: LamG domain-containing protein, partial [Planctomycetes bacterium]|nr:LamG domain-containing protein [Planctomycetota bacterium]
DSAGCDDVAYYYYPAVGDKLPVQWIPGWVVGAPAHAIQFRSFEYLYVEPCDPDDYINLPKGDYTLSCWMKTTPEFIFDDADFIGFGTSYGIGRDESAQVVEFQHGGFSGDTTSGTTPVGDGYWHHVAAVYEAPTRTSDGMVYLYVDGGLDATEKVDDNHTIDSQAQLRFAGNSSEVNNFTGALDDIRIYRRALSAIEVQYIIDPPLINAPPQIHLGDDTVVPYPNDTLILKAALYDDNYPLQQSPRLAWTKLAGPGDVNFDPCIVAPGDLPGFVPDVEYELETTITFSQPGFYTLRAKTDDLIYTDTDQIMVWVQPAAGMDRTVAYWRFEQDQKETDYPDTPDGDNPNTLIIANEIAGAPPLIATRDIAEEVPLLLGNVPVTPIPLTDSDNLHHLAQGAGLRDFWGDRRVTSGYDLNMQADYWPGLLFCRDGLTIECWIKTDDQDFTAFDLFGDGKGIKIYHDDSNPSAGLKLECYFETEVPNIFEHVILVTDIKLTADKWIHIAFTYEKSNGVIRIFADGIPAWITHYYYDGAWTEARPWINSFNTPDNRALALPENGNLFINTGINTEDSALDELRISAATLYPPRFLNVGPTLCVTPVPADLDGDCDVDLIDFMLFGNSWLLCNNADLTECFKKQ